MPIDPLSLGLSVVSGLFGGGRQRYDPSQRLQLDIARQLQAYAGGVPGSDPAEQAALAQARGQLGQEQLQQRNALFAAMPQFAQGATGDLLANLGTQQIGQRTSLDIAHRINSLNARRQALLDSASVARGVGPREREQSQVGEALAGLAYQVGQQRALRRRRPGGGAEGPGGMAETAQGPGPSSFDLGGGVTGPFGIGGGQPAAQGLLGPVPEMVSNPFEGPETLSALQQLVQQSRAPQGGLPQRPGALLPGGLPDLGGFGARGAPYDIGAFLAPSPLPAGIGRPRRRR